MANQLHTLTHPSPPCLFCTNQLIQRSPELRELQTTQLPQLLLLDPNNGDGRGNAGNSSNNNANNNSVDDGDGEAGNNSSSSSSSSSNGSGGSGDGTVGSRMSAAMLDAATALEQHGRLQPPCVTSTR